MKNHVYIHSHDIIKNNILYNICIIYEILFINKTNYNLYVYYFLFDLLILEYILYIYIYNIDHLGGLCIAL